MKCDACSGERFRTRTVELPIRVGDHSVISRAHRRPVCLTCGEYAIPARLLEALAVQAAVIAFTQAPRVSGDMLLFGRKALGLTQTELAERLGSTTESISRWECEEGSMEAWVPLGMLALLRERLIPPPRNVEFRRAG